MNDLNELREKAMTLPKADRLRLAQSLWDSVEDPDLPGFTEMELTEELRARLADEPDETWKTHEQVMAEAKRKYG